MHHVCNKKHNDGKLHMYLTKKLNRNVILFIRKIYHHRSDFTQILGLLLSKATTFRNKSQSNATLLHIFVIRYKNMITWRTRFNAKIVKY